MQETEKSNCATEATQRGSGILLVALLAGALALICNQAFQAHTAMWANDSQLGALKASCSRLPDTFFGHWIDSWWIGMDIPANSPSLTLILADLISPEMFLKIFTPLTMLLMGFSAWVLFRQLKFAPMVCVIGGLAAGLNMHCFSNASWGLGTWNVAIAMIFLGVAALVTTSIRQTWIKAILAGLAVGLAVMEGFDSGAILSVYIGAFAVFFCWATESSVSKKIIKTLWVEALIVGFAVLIAASTLYTLVGTQVKGMSGGGQSPEEKKAYWTFATQWSLPKLETLKVVIPGIFGYRMDEFSTPPDPLAASFGKFGGWSEEFIQGLQDKSSAYWGRVGEDPRLTAIPDLESKDPDTRAAALANFTDRKEYLDKMRSDDMDFRNQIVASVKSQMQGLQHRHSGNGEYAGVVTALFALFAIFNSFRSTRSPYTPFERKMVWFWALATLFSLMAAWGRFSFLYGLLYQLPGVSSIRNPIKFMHPFVVTWVILAGFGLEAFYRCYFRAPAKTSTAAQILESDGGGKRTTFDLIWAIGLAVAVFALIAGLGDYAGSKLKLVDYLTGQGFTAEQAPRIASFSINEAHWFVLIFALTAAVAISGVFMKWPRRWAWTPWALLCGIMIFDMTRSNLPWVRYYNYDQKYSMNDVTKLLMDKPFEHRVTGRLNPRGGYDIPGDGNFGAAIHWWIENDFPYHDIQSLEVDQMPRTPTLDMEYMGAFPYTGDNERNITAAARMWKLTNTRYLLASAALLPAFNKFGDPGHDSFKYAERFNLVAKPGYTMTPNSTNGLTLVADAGDITPQITPDGAFSLIEFTNALPRAKLYTHWLVPPTDQAAAQTLMNPQWDPATSVLVSSNTPVPPSPTTAVDDTGTVNITSYLPMHINLQAEAKSPSVLLYNDRTAKDWRVWVDGKESPLLRCNYIMRGVYLPAGSHAVEFRFTPSLAALYVTLLAWVIGLALAAYLIWSHFAAKRQITQP